MNDGRPTWIRWQIIGLLIAFSFMTWLNRVSMAVAGDERIMPLYKIETTKMGMVYSAFFFAYMICMTPGGWLIDRVGPKLALVIMGFASALFGALTSVAGLPAVIAAGLLLPALFGIRALMGVFTAPVYPASSRMVSHWIPWSQRSWANGLVQGSAAVGMAAAFPVFGALIDWFDWPTAFLITGGCTAALALLWTVYATNYPSQHRLVNEAERKEIGTDLVMGRSDGDDETEPAPSWSLLLRHRSLVLLTVAYAAVGYIEYLFFFWMHYYFETVLKLEKDESRIYTTYMFLTMAIGMAFGGWLSDRLQVAFGPRWGRAAVPMAGMIVGAALLGLGLTAHDTTWIVIWLCLSLGAVGACEAPVWTTAVELGGRHGGTAAGICNTGGNLGGLLAPMVTPWISQLVLRYGGSRGVDETTSWQIAISVGAVICLSGAVLWLWIDPRERVVLATPSDTESYDTES